ncbi:MULTISPECIES: NADP-dependent oxidoreductase [unclassified Methanosarcina]|uniref:NADP-dependent oxidoreductase n=1 Tax=unclassified Methanosarcina TaxID=2644672 RepID=UPI00061565F2|nr:MULTISPECIES: NADP-dependent oxidoreductase [unclassified Methanosarcina]AKB19266.1 Bifunctional protein: zinc-containing alcohol dehydrogenase [Methanosarcina sp. WWM596]AKB22904.1 Bifunctional protein: zinc-containing alcohol dehydrogenase [Methanosarcina sp. WH1]
MENMKAVRIHEFGGPEVLKYEKIPEPHPGPGEIRIRIIATGVNPIDWKIRRGLLGEMPLPMTMGLDVAGIVDAQGREKGPFQSGEEVFAKVSIGQGGYAEYTVVNSSQAARKPRSIGFIESASIPTAGLAAWQSLFDIAGLEKGQSILIHGAAGGVGSFAVQFAKWKGAYIFGTASEKNKQFLKSIGADEFIDYKNQRFEDVAGKVDVVLDTIGGDTFERSWEVLKPGGFLVSTVAGIPEKAPEKHGVRAQTLMTQANGGELAQIAAIIDEQPIKPVVTTVLPLSEARKAHEMSESRHTRGKIVLRVAEDPQ